MTRTTMELTHLFFARRAALAVALTLLLPLLQLSLLQLLYFPDDIVVVF